mmetsp:Transcript_7760/g.14757  ORF Transcript_7760/g.14757 Transcript_7760/m.14757 type:complete len:171 (-) Transcript_7760:2057-2569(-)
MKTRSSSSIPSEPLRVSRFKHDEELFLTDDEFNPNSSKGSVCDPLDFTLKPVRKRKRKSNAQLNVLKAEFELDPHWTKERISALSEKTGLSEGQIYKWSWDYRKKLKDSGSLTEYNDTLTCREVLQPCLEEQEEYRLLSAYRKAWSACFKQYHDSGFYLPDTQSFLREEA